jgi:uncharacterized Zn finger protein
MKQEYFFKVKGSNGLYEVNFIREGNKLTITCTCPAGMNRLCCKHRFALMQGNDSSVIGPNRAEVEFIVDLLKGTSVEKAYSQMLIAEKSFEVAKHELTKRKKILADAMHNGE